MTAVVGILNKKAVAIAADSAVTLHNGKIFNKANKIFTLSKYHPVGIMIHNVDSLMGTPWETIIKIYRQQLKDKSFDTLKDYQKDFIDFLKKEDFYCSTDQQAFQLNLFCLGINSLFIQEINKILSADDPDYLVKFHAELKNQAQLHIDAYSKVKDILPDFVGYTYQQFDNYIEGKLQEVLNYSFVNNGYPIDADTRTLLKQAYFSELIVKEFSTTSFTGLVFTGFGKKEIFPSLIPLQVYFGFEKKLRYFINEGREAIITHDLSSAVCTFAQSDVMFTILTGVAPDLKETYNLNFKNFIHNYEDLLIKNYPGGDKGDLKYLLNLIDKDRIAETFNKTMDQVIQQKYVTPLFEAVAGLSKEDLAEMAESLIYLTYLQRRITNAEESVGGPVDVAILSKGDGFIWIKRKHYFKPELNSHFFKNYFV
jgi:hypothetical protein